MNPFRCGRYHLDLARPLVMGVVNITPDSFFDGGAFASAGAAIAQAQRLIAEGADLLDLGAESSRPGAAPIAPEQELERLLPVLRALRDVEVPLSVDTCKPEVMRAALDEGASMINDIYAFRLPGAIDVVAQADCGLCAMHMQRDPQSMQLAPVYDDVLVDVNDFLAARLAALEAAGIARARITLDPGFGFGKTVRQNYQLLNGFERLRELGVPLLVGLSRKSMLGAVTGKAAEERLAASLAAALAAVTRGAAIIRVHDVAATVDAFKIWHAVEFPESVSEPAPPDRPPKSPLI